MAGNIAASAAPRAVSAPTMRSVWSGTVAGGENLTGAFGLAPGVSLVGQAVQFVFVYDTTLPGARRTTITEYREVQVDSDTVEEYFPTDAVSGGHLSGADAPMEFPVAPVLHASVVIGGVAESFTPSFASISHYSGRQHQMEHLAYDTAPLGGDFRSFISTIHSAPTIACFSPATASMIDEARSCSFTALESADQTAGSFIFGSRNVSGQVHFHSVEIAPAPLQAKPVPPPPAAGLLASPSPARGPSARRSLFGA